MYKVDTREVQLSGASTLHLIILVLAIAILVVDLSLSLRRATFETGSPAMDATVPAQQDVPSIARPVAPTVAPLATAAPYVPSIVRPAAPAPTAAQYVPSIVRPVGQPGS
ncbi:MAG: hypothetical protein ACJ776_10705 [Chloroflexota bacterium]